MTTISFSAALAVLMVGSSGLRECAMAEYNNSQFAAALEKFKQLAQSPTSTPEDYYWLGEAHFQLSQFEKAAEAFEKATAAKEEARVRLVEAWLAARRKDKAAAACATQFSHGNSPYTVAKLTALRKVLSTSSRPLPSRKGGIGEK